MYPPPQNTELDEQSIARKVLAARVDAFTDRAVSGAWTSPLGTALLAWTQLEVAGWRNALLWFCMMNTIEALIIGVGYRYRKSASCDNDAMFWARVQTAISMLLGLGWSTSVWFFWVDGQFMSYMVNLTILVGVSAVSIIIMAPIRQAAVLFTLGMMFPLLLHLMVVANPLWAQIIAGLVVLFVIQLRYGRMVEKELFRALDRAVRNANLVDMLTQTRGALHSANLQLIEKNATLEKALSSLHELVTHDELTGVYNRRFILEHMEIQIASKTRHATPVSVVMFDLDFFKTINDRFGHPIGDKALQVTVAAVQAELRDGEQLARVGGEEFMVLLPLTAQSAAAVLGERLRLAIEAISLYEGEERVVLTASFGVAELRPAEDLASWLRRVDAALYQAKAKGRNCLVIVNGA